MKVSSIKWVLACVAPMILSGNADAVQVKYDFAGGQPFGSTVNDVSWLAQSLIDSFDFNTGLPTGIALTQISATGFNEVGPNTSGTTAPGAPASSLFDSASTADNLFGHSNNFNIGAPRPVMTYIISGLDGSGATSYDFSFFASRLGPTDNREAQYSVAGANNGVAFLDSVGNTSNIAQVLGIIPDGSGNVTLNIQKGPNNNNGSGFFYLGAMDITSVPEPASMALLGLGGLLITARRRG